MTVLIQIIRQYYQRIGTVLQPVDGLPSLLLRLFLIPIFWTAGTHKLMAFGDTVAWFGSPEYGLGLPFPALMAALAVGAEVGGAVLLALGLFTRLICIPLIITMLVAIFTVHWEYGWQAIADPSSPFANMRVSDANAKLMMINEILQMHGDYDSLTSNGKVVILNNGIEFAVTYALMLLALLRLGGGRFVSLDYYLTRYCVKRAHT